MLPTTIWEEVFSYLSLPSLLSARCVCHTFREIGGQNFLWEPLLKSTKPDAYSSMKCHSKFNSTRAKLSSKDATLSATLTGTQMYTEALSPPGSVLQAYMKHCLSVQTQHHTAVNGTTKRRTSPRCMIQLHFIRNKNNRWLF